MITVGDNTTLSNLSEDSAIYYPSSMAEDNIEVVGTLRLPLGGLNGYMNVRGKQGRKKDKFQGCTPNKTRRTSLYNTPREAAVALAKLKQRPEALSDPANRLRLPGTACRFGCFASGRLPARRSTAAASRTGRMCIRAAVRARGHANDHGTAVSRTNVRHAFRPSHSLCAWRE